MDMQEVINFQRNNDCVLLGISPMSKIIIDSVIEYANSYRVPLMLIASRRQVDSKKFGGGYVEGWDSQSFSKYIKKRDKGGMIIICRDHAGPWQNDFEKRHKIEKAMDLCKKSLKEDIDSNFDIIHLDPSVSMDNSEDIGVIEKRLFDLYDYCNKADRKNRITYEVGTEEQSGKINSLDDLERFIIRIKKHCLRNNFIPPKFAVAQIGTLVKETRNLGLIGKEGYSIDELKTTIKICNRHNILLKAHNCDYLSNKTLKSIRDYGVHSINIGPEFGVAQTKSIIKLCEDNDLNKEKEKFLRLSLDSEKWKKWMINEENASNLEKSIISGHYIFSTDKFKAIYADIENKLNSKGISLDDHLKKDILKLLDRKCRSLGLRK